MRDEVGMGIGDRVVVEARGDEVVIRRPRGVLEFAPPPSQGQPAAWPEARRRARAARVRALASDDR